jgi:acid phosphatase type 7
MKLHPLLLATALVLCPALEAATTIVRGPYLQSATPTSLVVRWRTDSTEASVVSYGTDRAQLTSTAKAEGISSEHIVQLTGLKPNTKYYYAVGAIPLPPPNAEKKAAAEDAPGRATINSFTTPPAVGPAKPSRIWVLGDAGTKNAVQTAVRDVYYKFNGNRQTDAILLLGDNAYPDGTDTDYQKGIFEMYNTILRSSPLWSCIGNHDGKSSNSITQSGVYYDIFTFPTQGQAGGVV